MIKNYLNHIKAQKQERAAKLSNMDLKTSIRLMESIQSGVSAFMKSKFTDDKPLSIKLQIDKIRNDTHRI